MKVCLGSIRVNLVCRIPKSLYVIHLSWFAKCKTIKIYILKYTCENSFKIWIKVPGNAKFSCLFFILPTKITVSLQFIFELWINYKDSLSIHLQKNITSSPSLICTVFPITAVWLLRQKFAPVIIYKNHILVCTKNQNIHELISFQN